MSKRQPNTRPRQRANRIEIDAAEFRRRQRSVPMPTADNEFCCDTCKARCTRTTAGTELGHKYGCPERPEGLPAGQGGGGAWHGGESE